MGSPLTELNLPLFTLRSWVRHWLSEDLGPGDLTTGLVVPGDRYGHAEIVAKEAGVVCGLPLLALVFTELDEGVVADFCVLEGAAVAPGEVVAQLTGPLRPILSGERLALNLLQRLSGIATVTRASVEAVSGYQTVILDTRKTTPGLRALEKYAVRIGGGRSHRFGLFDGILIKDNHIRAVGSIRTAVEQARARAPHTMAIEVEVTNLAELEEALAAGADWILLDNMDTETIREAVRLVAGRARLEASGGIDLPRAREIAAVGVDAISVGALTHSARALNFSLEITEVQN